jgi:hypothetical protein
METRIVLRLDAMQVNKAKAKGCAYKSLVDDGHVGLKESCQFVLTKEQDEGRPKRANAVPQPSKRGLKEG